MLRLFLLHLLIILALTGFSQIPRGRVQIKNGTLVSDSGTLLRGAYISTDISPTLPLKSDLKKLKNLGFNCIHLYAECPQYMKPGDSAILVDSIVKWTRNESLYLILNIGGCHQNGQFDLTFVKDFWNFYAPRYKDETHVVYEICNEPFGWSAPYDANTIEMEVTAYNIIRAKAPETHILLMSYSEAIKAASVISDCKKLGTGIDWSNASIASHGYGIASEELNVFISTIKNAGYALTITEPAEINEGIVNLATTRIFENEFVSYTHYISAHSIISDPSVYKSKIEGSEIRWVPDFGTWPGTIPKTTYKNPFTSYVAGFYDKGYGFKIYGTNVGSVSNNDYVGYYNFDFQMGTSEFEVKCTSGGLGGKIELHLDSVNGQLLGTCAVSSSGSWDIISSYACKISQISGVHDIYFLFKGGIYDLFNMNSFIFKPNATDNFTLLDNQIIKIFPNPAKSQINVTCDEISTIEICDAQGRILIKAQLSEINNIISVANLASGSYIVKILGTTKVTSKLLIIY